MMVDQENNKVETVVPEAEESEKSELETTVSNDTPSEGSAQEGATAAPKGEEVDYFSSPDKLPPELQKYYKAMQASYTKKMQQLSETLERLKPHAERLTLLEKAMSGDRDAIKALETVIPKVSDDVDTAQLDKYIEAKLSNYLEPILKQVAYQQQFAEYQAVKQKYPDFDNYIPEMIEVRQKYPGLSLEDAYKLVTYNKPVKAGKTITKPTVRNTSVKAKEPDKLLSFEEAAELALKQLKGGE